jgi:hypothetical protein
MTSALKIEDCLSQIRTRPMTADDMIKLSRYVLPRFVGKVAEIDGEFYCSCSIIWGPDDRAFLCLDASDKFAKSAVFLHRHARLFIKEVSQVLDVIYTIESKDVPTAKMWLGRLGFKPTDETIKGERVLSWRRSSERSLPSAAH